MLLLFLFCFVLFGWVFLGGGGGVGAKVYMLAFREKTHLVGSYIILCNAIVSSECSKSTTLTQKKDGIAR